MLRSPLFNELLSLRDTVDQMFRENPFGDAFGTLWSRSESSNGSVPRPMPLDIYSTDDNVVIIAAVPGMHPDDLDLTVQRNTVTLSGTIRDAMGEDEAKEVTWYARELTRGTYRRSITLPFAVDADHATAEFEHGILRVVLPKEESARPRRISIQPGSHKEEAIEAGAAS
ncbi:MAG TPA: Hsp20/alpha crystallin family protein [Thermomicrobiales bacterium]|jgi:HSP20 family protein|nr:Hsp20/alpha crystallin family protein [Thermomicrobiales bacterium]